ncbi:protein phosphatase 1 regulatory subunit 15B [Brachionichthys hirsutus]|uniref:protein phosphatase 1 regulatory subunit 15B n=1 Tax=Brachionichthys hirsutus TaxID=412623 RepID=UPI0036048A8F
MAPAVGRDAGSEPAAMERFGRGGLALLPWTKQMLAVLWEQLRLLLSVIYYTCVSVFQMFRFEVHVRITDEVQHMTAAANPSESFLFSSLFDGDGGVMVGGSNPLSNFCAEVGDPFAGKSPAEALLSSLRADDLCCGLVDDFVSLRTGREDAVFRGRRSSWKVGFPGDWNIFVSSSEGSGSDDACHRSGDNVSKRDIPRADAPEEDRSSRWSSEEDQNAAEFDSEESKALWESLSRSSDPYNPFFFSACISTNTNVGKTETDAGDGGDADRVSVAKVGEDAGPRGPDVWVGRCDSDSSWSSWAGSDGSAHDLGEENERLLELFASPDPYNPMCFTASRVGGASGKSAAANACKRQASLPVAEEESGPRPSSAGDDEREEERLWKSLRPADDPYHPLNFQACLQTARRQNLKREAKTPQTPRVTKPKPPLQERHVKRHPHPDKARVPWTRPGRTLGCLPQRDGRDGRAGAPPKKVRFSPLVQVHVMRAWAFARQACRKGPWEEMARDRDRFGRRIREAEQAIGYCFTPLHRQSVQTYPGGALERKNVPSAEC